MIEIKNLYKNFGLNKVLNGVDLKIEKGRTLAVIGQSGCGKSVLLKHIIGLINPDKGKILIEGKNIAELKDEELKKIRLKFGMVFQESALFDSLNIRDNVGFSLIEHTFLKKEEIDYQVKKSLSRVALAGIENKMPSQISPGMRKRVALARAISMNPEIILYDEPTAGIDPIMADSVSKLIKDLHLKLKTTAVIVTHDMNLAYYAADQIAMLYKGKIITLGTPEEIRASSDKIVSKFVNGISEGFDHEI